MRKIRDRADVRKIIAVVKADAYGHGAVAAARTLSSCGADYLAAGSFDEGIQLRRADVACPIIVLGSPTPTELAYFQQFDLIPSLDDRQAVEALALRSERPVPVFIKVDCGFGRYGISLPGAAEFIRFVAGFRQLKIEGIYTHLPYSDAAGRSWALRQQSAFKDLVTSLSAEGLQFPVVQSAATPLFLTDVGSAPVDIAAGHLLYGMDPMAGEFQASPALEGFSPAFRRVGTKLVHVGNRLAGEAAALYLRGCRGALGVVPIGIRHNYRPSGDAACMIVNGVKVPVLRVCLESTILDLDAVGAAEVGTDVTVIGDDGGETVTLQDVATWQRASPLATLIGLGQAIPRIYGGGPGD